MCLKLIVPKAAPTAATAYRATEAVTLARAPMAKASVRHNNEPFILALFEFGFSPCPLGAILGALRRLDPTGRLCGEKTATWFRCGCRFGRCLANSAIVMLMMAHRPILLSLSGE